MLSPRTHPQILASGRISGRDQDLGISISSSSSLLAAARIPDEISP
jgi:hypothetical protein